MITPLGYFHDKSMTKRYEVNELGFPIVDWGEIIPGKQLEKTLYVMNESKDKLVIRQPFTTSTELTINDYPSRLFAGDKGQVKLSYKSNPEKIEAHNSTWGFEVILG